MNQTLLPLIKFLAILVLLFAGPHTGSAQADEMSPGTGPRHAIAMHGEPLYKPGFTRFKYTDPYAERGGDLVIGEIGTFDNLNAFIVKGTSPLVQLESAYLPVQLHTIESLMVRGHDEPFTLYGLIAKTIEVPEDRSWVEFTLNEKARFADGSAVTVDDVIFSLETLRDKGRPNTRRFYDMVSKIERPADHKVRFVFTDEANQEMPLIMGLMPVLSKSFYSTRKFEETTLVAPLGSGPYSITQIDPGRSIVLTRNPDYWGAGLAVNAGQHNFDTIRYDYFRDSTALFEAFKSGEVSIRFEREAKTWATGYDFTATRNGQIIQQEITHGRPADMYGLVFNTRRDYFKDKRVRQALLLMLDFEWMNENFFYNSYKRVQSYFENSELSSRTVPASVLEKELLKPFKKSFPQSFFDTRWSAPIGGSSANSRINKAAALSLLGEAGWSVTDGQMVNTTTGEPFTFEIMLREPSEERIALTYASALKSLGIDITVRMVDSTQYHARRSIYDFDMTAFKWRGTLSPGNEQAFRFGSQEADIEGTFNLAGVKDPAVDAMIESITQAQTRTALVDATRALDRVLLSGSYVIPFFYLPVDRLAYWSEVQVPDQTPLTGVKLQTMWMLPDH